MNRHPNLLALAAILQWGSLAALTVHLASVPPFLLLGLTLCVGSLTCLPSWRAWRVPVRTFAVGTGGIFGYHLCLFLALRSAPPLDAMLINYLWPLLIVLLSPLVLSGVRLQARHIAGGIAGFAGCALVMLGKGEFGFAGQYGAGYGLAMAAAVLWALYSLLTRRLPAFPSAAVGGFCLMSGVLALMTHALIEPAFSLTISQWGMVLLLGLGPMGIAFYCWDAALKRGDARTIGTLAYLTPVLSTVMLAVFANGKLNIYTVSALGLILGGAWLGRDVRPENA
ncbi:EamA family transporter [Burkholderiaceae bacterium DAT-1]|nr:EamA family transporter [Burkholderiaceae bacterium DAT-1]